MDTGLAHISLAVTNVLSIWSLHISLLVLTIIHGCRAAEHSWRLSKKTDSLGLSQQVLHNKACLSDS